MSAGDGLGMGEYAIDAGSSSQSQNDALSGRVDDMMNRMGRAGKMNNAKFRACLSAIERKVGAKTSTQKEAVAETLTFLGIVNGSGPHVKYEDIEFAPAGCSAVMMNEVIDNIVTRAQARQFMIHFSSRALLMVSSSPTLVNVLTPRAIRNGLPISDVTAVIDFLDNTQGVSVTTVGYRLRARFSATQRANKQPMSAPERTALRATADMHSADVELESDAGL